uniref:Uncharacterized protein n=1 Tax=Tanacetum cinerariifolium TaxID=118510 RepID=A0A6L2K6W2_TANCI|nr:hypothetical protein [Tanacetum cinerariifolium]
MSTQQDIYAAGSESRPPMLNKENYVPWSSRLLQYAKSRPNGKLIHNSILNGPYVRKMIPEPSDANRDITVTETFHLQTDDELSYKELKQIEADDQAIQTILLGLCPSCNFEKFTQLVPGLLSLTFDGFGFDLWVKLVLELMIFDKLSFNVRLFDEKLLPDPAFLCGL